MPAGYAVVAQRRVWPPKGSRLWTRRRDGLADAACCRLAGMSRRADPDRIFAAWRLAIRNTLAGEGMSLDEAERWCEAWDAEAAGRWLPKDAVYWELGAEWIREQRKARRLNPR